MQVENQFSKLWDDVGKQVFADLPPWEDGTTMPELFESLSVTNFCFWNLSSSPREWEIYCTTEKLDGALIHINMRDFEYSDFSMDT